MWAVALAMMALMFFGGGHFFHKHDDGHGKKQTAATTETQPVHSHGIVTDSVEGRDKGDHQHEISGGQFPAGDAEGPPDACTGDPENPGAQSDDCN